MFYACMQKLMWRREYEKNSIFSLGTKQGDGHRRREPWRRSLLSESDPPDNEPGGDFHPVLFRCVPLQNMTALTITMRVQAWISSQL
jgi:hypothetical protein